MCVHLLLSLSWHVDVINFSHNYMLFIINFGPNHTMLRVKFESSLQWAVNRFLTI